MRTRTRHRRLAAAACRVYSLTIWLYPAEFRRTFGDELAVTFRSRVEDVLETGRVRDWLAFVVHIAVDMLNTCSMLAASSHTHDDDVSLLGLSDGAVAHGGLDRATLDIHAMFVTAGVALAFGGWFAFFVILPTYVH